MRQTSVEAYHSIEAGGLLSRLRFECYELLYHHGPLTAGELMEKARAVRPNWSDRHVWSLEKRLSELRDIGTARETGKRPCRISGRLCIEWDVTDGLPQEVVKANSKTVSVLLSKIVELEEKVERVARLEAKVDELRELVAAKGSQGYFFK